MENKAVAEQQTISTNKKQDNEERAQFLQEDEDTIDLVELFYVLLYRWKWLAAATLLCAAIAAVCVFFFITPMYEATSTIYVLGRSDSVINVSDLNLGSALTKDYIKIFNMWEVHEQVISDLGLPYSYSEMNSMLTVTNDSDTRMLDITFKSASPEEAALVANEYANVVIEYIADTMKTDKPTVMSSALVPSNPVSPNKTKIILIAAVAGLVVSAGAVVVLHLLDDTYKTPDDIKKYTDLVTLASIPMQKNTTENHGKPKAKRGKSPLGGQK